MRVKYPLEKITITLAEIGMTLDQAVDNTGNIRVWPSEEIFTLYLTLQSNLKDQIMAQSSVIEFGAGKSGLVGFSLAKQGLEVLITDGNDQCVSSLN